MKKMKMGPQRKSALTAAEEKGHRKVNKEWPEW